MELYEHPIDELFQMIGFDNMKEWFIKNYKTLTKKNVLINSLEEINDNEIYGAILIGDKDVLWTNLNLDKPEFIYSIKNVIKIEPTEKCGIYYKLTTGEYVCSPGIVF